MWLAPRANGFFSIGEVASADVLWCLSTGTGIGPFLSMLRTDDAYAKFERVVLVHAVRRAEELTYRAEIAAIARARAGAFTYIPIVSREAHPEALPGRIPALIADGRLEARAGIALSPENAQAHAMLCGNPAMVEETQALLGTRGMRRHRRREPGACHRRDLLVVIASARGEDGADAGRCGGADATTVRVEAAWDAA